jgi:hypothetical protein
MKMTGVFLATLAVTLLAPVGSFADDTFNWSFAASAYGVFASGTLTAVADPSGTPGLYDITGGSGLADYSGLGGGSSVGVTIAPCSTPSSTCTVVDTDGKGPGSGANLTYDNLLWVNNAPGSQLDDNGVVLTPSPLGSGFPNPTYVEVWDSPSQYFFSWGTNGYENLSTPFTVTATPSAAVPEPGAVVLLIAMLLGIGSLSGALRKNLARAKSACLFSPTRGNSNDQNHRWTS